MLQVWIGFQMLEHLVPVHVGHHDVEQDEVDGFCPQQFQSFAPVSCGRNIRKSLAAEPSRERIPIVLVVVDDEESSSRRNVFGSIGLRMSPGYASAPDRALEPVALICPFCLRLSTSRRTSGLARGKA